MSHNQHTKAVRNPAYRNALQKLTDTVARLRPGERDQAYADMLHQERMRKIRLIVFGSAPE